MTPKANAKFSGRLAESTRVEAFSDGVFAIALTLLVLDLQVPEKAGRFAHTLVDEWPTYAAFLAAFLNISAIWVSHHDTFTRVRRVDMRLMVINLLLLLISSLFPFPTAVISSAWRDGTHADQVSADVLYACIGVLLPLVWILLYRYLLGSPRLLTDGRTDGADAAYLRTAIRRAMVSVVIYPIAAAVALVAPLVSLVAFVALPLFFIGVLIRAPAGES